MKKILGITDISKRLNKVTRLGEEKTKEIISEFLDTIKKIIVEEGDDISFKNYFTLKRAKKAPSGSKHVKNTSEKWAI